MMPCCRESVGRGHQVDARTVQALPEPVLKTVLVAEPITSNAFPPRARGANYASPPLPTWTGMMQAFANTSKASPAALRSAGPVSPSRSCSPEPREQMTSRPFWFASQQQLPETRSTPLDFIRTARSLSPPGSCGQPVRMYASPVDHRSFNGVESGRRMARSASPTERRGSRAASALHFRADSSLANGKAPTTPRPDLRKLVPQFFSQPVPAAAGSIVPQIQVVATPRLQVQGPPVTLLSQLGMLANPFRFKAQEVGERAWPAPECCKQACLSQSSPAPFGVNSGFISHRSGEQMVAMAQVPCDHMRAQQSSHTIDCASGGFGLSDSGWHMALSSPRSPRAEALAAASSVCSVGGGDSGKSVGFRWISEPVSNVPSVQKQQNHQLPSNSRFTQIHEIHALPPQWLAVSSRGLTPKNVPGQGLQGFTPELSSGVASGALVETQRWRQSGSTAMQETSSGMAPRRSADSEEALAQCVDTKEKVSDLAAVLNMLVRDVDGMRQDNLELRRALRLSERRHAPQSESSLSAPVPSCQRQSEPELESVECKTQDTSSSEASPANLQGCFPGRELFSSANQRAIAPSVWPAFVGVSNAPPLRSELLPGTPSDIGDVPLAKFTEATLATDLPRTCRQIPAARDEAATAQRSVFLSSGSAHGKAFQACMTSGIKATRESSKDSSRQGSQQGSSICQRSEESLRLSRAGFEEHPPRQMSQGMNQVSQSRAVPMGEEEPTDADGDGTFAELWWPSPTMTFQKQHPDSVASLSLSLGTESGCCSTGIGDSGSLFVGFVEGGGRPISSIRLPPGSFKELDDTRLELEGCQSSGAVSSSLRPVSDMRHCPVYGPSAEPAEAIEHKQAYHNPSRSEKESDLESLDTQRTSSRPAPVLHPPVKSEAWGRLRRNYGTAAAFGKLQNKMKLDETEQLYEVCDWTKQRGVSPLATSGWDKIRSVCKASAPSASTEQISVTNNLSVLSGVWANGKGWKKVRCHVQAAMALGGLLRKVREKQAEKLYERDWNRQGFGGSGLLLMGTRLPSASLGSGSLLKDRSSASLRVGGGMTSGVSVSSKSLSSNEVASLDKPCTAENHGCPSSQTRPRIDSHTHSHTHSHTDAHTHSHTHSRESESNPSFKNKASPELGTNQRDRTSMSRRLPKDLSSPEGCAPPPQSVSACQGHSSVQPREVSKSAPHSLRSSLIATSADKRLEVNDTSKSRQSSLNLHSPDLFPRSPKGSFHVTSKPRGLQCSSADSSPGSPSSEVLSSPAAAPAPVPAPFSAPLGSVASPEQTPPACHRQPQLQWLKAASNFSNLETASQQSGNTTIHNKKASIMPGGVILSAPLREKPHKQAAMPWGGVGVGISHQYSSSVPC
ncbi:unnamed protein product [Polarella glacialis]|uniref:Uncharacterized protein n=1 Tax=Polarella glacialis TaxID=89957 RepID=A0A813L8G2_POLGL|nr:unnamed protein product [Polarella glacialis]|mmetsp:Transcript_15273/g.24336  ORF Transcript_15273/g.24336 Transcript_15273/m.24336 type:complete len:1359 (-) Transcript_15273:37-4113(-)